jgi:hypothetical protein
MLNLDAELSRFSRIGLRTLLIAMKTISEEGYKNYREEVIRLNPQEREKSL